MRVFGREPAVALGFIASILGIGTALGFDGLSHEHVALIVAAISAVAGAVAAVFTVPRAPAAFTAAVAAVAALFAGYGLELSGEMIAAVNFFVMNALAFFGIRPQVVPTDSANAPV